MAVRIWILGGQMGTGKNWVANWLSQRLEKPIQLALAGHFKVDAVAKLGADWHKVFVKKDQETRKKLQITGTEEGRVKYGEDIWANVALVWVSQYLEQGFKNIIIVDGRFPNEFYFFKKANEKLEKMTGINWDIKTICIRLIAPKRNLARLEEEGDLNLANHPSEQSINTMDLSEFDFVIKNDPEDDAVSQLEKMF